MNNKKAVRDLLKFPRKSNILDVNSEFVFGLVMKILPACKRGMHTESLIMSLEFLLEQAFKGLSKERIYCQKIFPVTDFSTVPCVGVFDCGCFNVNTRGCDRRKANTGCKET